MDANGASVADAAALAAINLVPTACGTTAADVPDEEVALDVLTMKFDPLTGEWHFNWKTAKAQVGCFLLEARLADESVHSAAFELR